MGLSCTQPLRLTHAGLEARNKPWGTGLALRISAALIVGLFASLPLIGAPGRYSYAAGESEGAPQTAGDRQYQACLASAGAAHDTARAAECKRLADRTETDRANCLDKLKLPKIYCDASYAPRDSSPTCALPEQAATVLDAELAHARFRCARERKADEGKL
jgi:hypothetical protein